MAGNRRQGHVWAAVAVAAAFAIGVSAAECEFERSDKHSRLLLRADCETESTILVPDGFTLDGDGHKITAVERFPGGWVGPIIRNEGSRARVKDLVLTAEDLECACKSGDDRLRGIFFDEAQGSIRDSVIVNINKGECGCQEGYGITVSQPPFDGSAKDGHRPHVLLEGNVLRGYQKGGIVAQGAIDVTIDGNVVEGAGPVFYIAQNGIQVGFGASGRVEDNTAANNWHTGSSAAAGVLIFQSDGVRVSDNAAVRNETGIGIATFGWFASSASRNRIVKNFVSRADNGITVTSAVFDFSDRMAIASGNQVFRNTLVDGQGGDVGIQVDQAVRCDRCPFTASTVGTWVRKNTVVGFDDAFIDLDGPAVMRGLLPPAGPGHLGGAGIEGWQLDARQHAGSPQRPPAREFSPAAP